MRAWTGIIISFYLTVTNCDPSRRKESWVENKGIWYYISENPSDYSEATEICESMKAHLAVIRNEDQHFFLTKEISGRKDFWIGISNMKTDHNMDDCDEQIWFWNGDRNCTNTFSKKGINNENMSPTESGCNGVTMNYSRRWSKKKCFETAGFICQWECKRFYMKFDIKGDCDDSESQLNGMYKFDSYYNSVARYTREGSDGKIRIYKDSDNRWILNNDKCKNVRRRAYFITDSYVPYGRNLTWQNWNKRYVPTSTFCVECETLSMCDLGLPCQTLFLNDTVPAYVNVQGNVFLKHYNNSLSCLCQPSMKSCGNNCGYIFPYPTGTTVLILDSGKNVKFRNSCTRKNNDVGTTEMVTAAKSVSQTEADKQNTATTNGYWTTRIIAANKSQSHTEGETEKKTNVTTLLLTSVVPAIAIVIVFVVVIWIVLRNKQNSRKTKNSQTIAGTQIVNNRFGDGICDRESNVYTEVDALTNLSSNDHIDPSNKESTETKLHMYEDISTGLAKDNDTMVAHSEEKHIGGNLVPDYGVLINESQKQGQTTGVVNQKIKVEAIYTDVKKPNLQMESNGDDDLQLHENEIYDSQGGIGPVLTIPTNTCTQSSHSLDLEDLKYFNVDGLPKSNSDDDLELFENTVYNQTP